VGLKGVSFVHLNRRKLTKCREVIFEVIGEMICFPRRAIVELYIDDIVRILVCHFDNTDHVIRFKLTRQEVSYDLSCFNSTYPGNAFYSPSD
jgi:hypothetical protein